MLMNNKFKAQTVIGNLTVNSRSHVLAARASKMSCSFWPTISLDRKQMCGYHIGCILNLFSTQISQFFYLPITYFLDWNFVCMSCVINLLMWCVSKKWFYHYLRDMWKSFSTCSRTCYCVCNERYLDVPFYHCLHDGRVLWSWYMVNCIM